MKPGDLVRINLPRTSIGRALNGRLGIIVKPGERTSRSTVPLFVWWVLLDKGEMRSFEPSSLEVIG